MKLIEHTLLAAALATSTLLASPAFAAWEIWNSHT
jgi:hypothetical protein